ncbi:30S ribosomal protein S20 [Patescibacteria group bacterium]|nr:30S ribosomal protein S20 [Patescibacteria group bacterium]
MPVTKTAKRALRSSKKKAKVNASIRSNLEIAIRAAKKSKKKSDIIKAVSLADRAAKKSLIHKNKAARIKSLLSKLAQKKTSEKQKSKQRNAPSKTPKNR